jgi:predicted dehydrogenase
MVNMIVHQREQDISVEGDVVGVRLNFNPMLAGMAGAGGMMGPYHTADGQHGRIVRVNAVYDLKDIALDIAAAYGVPNAFFMTPADGSGWKPDKAWNKFLDTHLLTILSGPNNVHALQIEGVFNRTDASKRFVYTEKPVSNSLEGAVRVAEIEQRNPGRIAVVSQNRMWDMLLQARHLISTGAIGDIINFEVEYKQDWMNPGTPAVWRILKGIGGETGSESEGIIGKLVDIAYHSSDALQFLTGQRISAVKSAYVQNIVNERASAGGSTFGAPAVPKGTKVKVGGDTPYHGDDILDTLIALEKGAVGNMKVTQVTAGDKNMLRLKVYGTKGAIEFNTDNANDLVLYGFGNERTTVTRNPGALSYLATLPEWYVKGMRLENKAPFEGHTPPKHDLGWRDAHRRQLQAFALYAQLVNAGVIGVEEREKLYVVPTAAEALQVMSALKAVYQLAAETKAQEKKVVVYTAPVAK